MNFIHDNNDDIDDDDDNITNITTGHESLISPSQQQQQRHNIAHISSSNVNVGKNNHHNNRSTLMNPYGNLVLLSLSMSIMLGMIQNLMTIDRFRYGQWTYICYSIGLMLMSVSIYYVERIINIVGGISRTMILSSIGVTLFICIHLLLMDGNLLLFTQILIITLFFGPFYATQLEFITIYIVNSHSSSILIKRYNHRQLHQLLLLSPSFIIGHLIYLIVINLSHYNHHQYNHLNNTMNRSINDEWKSSSFSMNTLCRNLFKQQYCDHGLNFIFNNNNHSDHSTITFDMNIMKILIITMMVISLSLLLLIIYLSNRLQSYFIHNHYLQQQPINQCSIKNILYRRTLFNDNNIRLLLPMAFMIGFNHAFFIADYNKLYVSCALGFKAIGQIMLTRGIVHLLAILLTNEFIIHIKRPIILLSAMLCQLSVLCILYLWQPNDDLPIYYVITITYSLANGLMETLLYSIVLRTFCPDEWKYVFLTIYSMNNLGIAIALAMSEFICLNIKLITMIIIIIMAIIPMQYCELRLLKFEKILGPGSTTQL